jgi:hypothetical protein
MDQSVLPLVPVAFLIIVASWSKCVVSVDPIMLKW